MKSDFGDKTDWLWFWGNKIQRKVNVLIVFFVYKPEQKTDEIDSLEILKKTGSFAIVVKMLLFVIKRDIATNFDTFSRGFTTWNLLT